MAVSREVEEARRKWRYTGRVRPAFAEEPGEGRESVWDYPRPPRVEPETREVVVELAGVVVAESGRAVRVLETASPPTVYVPPDDVDGALLEVGRSRSFCEWKGAARHFTLAAGSRRVVDAAWSYPDPFPEFEAVRDLLAFYPGRVDGCTLGGVPVRPQPGGYYGGWLTPDVAGPVKGEPGSEDW